MALERGISIVRSHVRGGVYAALALGLLFPGEALADTRFGMQILPAHFSGDFGSGANTDITYVPLILGISSPRQEFRITVPYLTIRTDEPVTFVGGDVIGRPPRTTGSTGPSTESGLGDIVLREEFFFLEGDGEKRPALSAIGRVKLPTADEQRGLGTGEIDYGPGFGWIQPLGTRWSLLVEVDYIVHGDPPGTDLRNTFWNSAGVQLRPTAASSVYLLYDARQSVLEGRSALRDLTLGYDHRVSDTMTFRSTAFYGLSDTAEDFGVSLGFAMKERAAPKAD